MTVDPAIEKFWTERAAAGGDEPTINGWSAHSQRMRISQALKMSGRRAGESVLDFGCGTGALSARIDPRLYVGVDANAAMLDIARQLHPATEFRLGDEESLEGAFDHIFALGVWNVKPQAYQDVARSIEGLFEHARMSLTVSVLRSSRGDDLTWNPFAIASIAAKLSPHWALDCRHLSNDILITVSR